MDNIIRYKVLRRKNRLLKVETSRRGPGTNVLEVDTSKEKLVKGRRVLRSVPLEEEDTPKTSQEDIL